MVVRVVVGGGHGVTVHLVRAGTVAVVMSRHVTLHVRHRAGRVRALVGRDVILGSGFRIG